jgi:eukaryotic-like serine/threonine-protein kinase
MPMRSPAQRLLGREVGTGWKVVAEFEPADGGTGGNFSAGYIVQRGDKKAFLKALDFARALRASDPAQELQKLTEAFNFERLILKLCKEGRMSRVVQALEDGTVQVDEHSPAGIVQFLIFELADGDIRKQLEFNSKINIVWKLRTLHNAATGLKQLHTREIAHQDVKPSNVLCFGNEGSKLADLGRAAEKTQNPPHYVYCVQGDPCYAPPELAYGFAPTDWNERRYGCDAYLLGSLTVFLFTGASMTGLLMSRLPAVKRPGEWKGSFTDVLPELRAAFNDVMQLIESNFPEELRASLVTLVRRLCDPDPALRGHPTLRAQKGNPFDMERFISELDVMAHKAELILRTSRK